MEDYDQGILRLSLVYGAAESAGAHKPLCTSM